MQSPQEQEARSSDREIVARRGERRSRPTPRLSLRSIWKGRRSRVRRRTEVEGSFVDLYGARLFLVLLWIALMNAADSFFTLIHLQNGGTEVNPVAGVLLLFGRTPFIFSKSMLIALSLIVLCIHKNFHLARIGIWIAAGAYTVLFAYHLLLFQI